jgi:outer membrane protein assembly factor BamB
MTAIAARRPPAGRRIGARRHVAAAVLAAVVLVAGLTACGGKEPVHFRQEGVAESPVPDVEGDARLERVWRIRLGQGFSAEDPVLELAFDSGRIFVADPGGRVRALVAEDGEPVWERRLETRLVAGVGVGEGMVIVANAEGVVDALNADNGDRLWSAQINGDVTARPVIALGRVIIRTADGQIQGLDSANGEQLWRLRRPVPSLSLYGDSEPLVHGRAMVSGMADGRLVAIDLDSGQVLWEVPVTRAGGRNEIEQMTDIDADPILVGTIMYVAAYQGNLTAMALGSPQVLWSRELSTVHEIGFDEDHIYITDDEGRIHAYNRFSGEPQWQQERLRGRGVTGPVALNEALVVGDYQGFLYLLDPEDGSLIGRMSTRDDAFMTAPVRNGDLVYTLTENGTVTAWRASVATP